MLTNGWKVVGLMNIHRVTAAHLPQIQGLRDEHGVLLRQSNARHALPPLNNEEDWLHNPNCGVFVGVPQPTDSWVAGYIIAWARQSPFGELPENTGLITELVLDAHRYYGGLGRALVDAGRAWLTEQECQGVAALVPRFRPVEQAFWRALGAVPEPHGWDIMKQQPMWELLWIAL